MARIKANKFCRVSANSVIVPALRMEIHQDESWKMAVMKLPSPTKSMWEEMPSHSNTLS